MMTSDDFRAMLSDLGLPVSLTEPDDGILALAAERRMSEAGPTVVARGRRGPEWVEIARIQVPDVAAWNQWHLERFFAARDGAKNLTVGGGWTTPSEIIMMPHQNVADQAETIYQLASS